MTDRPLRVLHVSAGNMYGGVETFLVTLARRRDLCPAMAPEFATCFLGRLRDELTAAGVPVHDLGPARVGRPWTVMRARATLQRQLTDGRFDAVVCHLPWAIGLFGGLIERAEVPLVAHIHGALSGGWAERLAGRRRPSLLIAPSRHSLSICRRLYQTDIRGVVLNNPLPPQVTETPLLTLAERDEVRAGFGAGPGDIVFLQASRIEALKGPDLVVRAFGLLCDVPRWRLWLAGGPQRPSEQALYDECRRLAAEAGVLGRVSFLGQRDDVSQLMQATDVYIQGNRGPEGFGLTFVEAMYYGIPVITTDLGAAREVVPDSAGRLLPSTAEHTTWATCIEELIRQPDIRKTLGKAARPWARELCDPTRQLGRLAGWLNDIRSAGDPKFLP